MGRLTDALLDVLFPTKCILCRRIISPPGRPRICPDCGARLVSAAGDDTHGDYFSRCVSALYYEGQVKDAVRRYKFLGARSYDRAFGELVAARIYEDLDGRYDVLTWAPLSPDRLRQRGYDQTERIARDAARRLRVPLTRTLKKRRGVRRQSRTRGEAQRRRNIAGAYTVTDPAAVEGRRVLIIDDIVTTGSTLSECARTLLRAGAEEVLCVTLAKTR